MSDKCLRIKSGGAESVSGVVKPDKPHCQVPTVFVSLLDGLDELLPGDPLVLVLVHLAEHRLALVAPSALLEEEGQVSDDFLHLPSANRPIVVDVKHEEHSAQRLIYVPEGQYVIHQHELLFKRTRFIYIFFS